ncbi:MAG: energy-coupling factor transporter transmembrane protein EcfT [Clostridiales bacterium]|nr:energy-coupling factor transporter transmembrane protein EcfT [Candidatus Cacconaster stercorequi]
MCCTHPACLLISLTSAAAYLVVLRGGRELAAQCRWLLPVALCAAVLNPLFTHRGMTVLAHLPSGNPVTLESILYGLAAAAMLAAVFLWFVCFTDVVTSDKFIYLFGRIIPSLSLVLSMTLRFVPRFKAQMGTVARAQKSMGREISKGKLWHRIRNAVKVFSIVVTWSLEGAMETADSMKSRGYGEKGRTAFSVYRFDDRDRLLLLWLCFCGVYLLSGAVAGGFDFRYYPSVSGAELSPMGVSFFAVYAFLCLTPVILQRCAAERWRKQRKEGRIHE